MGVFLAGWSLYSVCRVLDGGMRDREYWVGFCCWNGLHFADGPSGRYGAALPRGTDDRWR